MQYNLLVISLSTVFLLHLSATAQQQMGSFMAYGPEVKYFSNLNYRVYQSKNGYLWFGTTNGLVRFDGKRYKNYFSNHHHKILIITKYRCPLHLQGKLQ